MHLRKCDTNICNNPATHWLVWTKPQFYCEECAQKMLNVGSAIGHESPATTIRLLTDAEMFLTDETDTEENQS